MFLENIDKDPVIWDWRGMANINTCTVGTVAFEYLYRQAWTVPESAPDLCSYNGYEEIKIYKDSVDIYIGSNDVCDEKFRIVAVINCRTAAMVYVGENGAIGLQLRDTTNTETSIVPRCTQTGYKLAAFNLNGDGVFGPYDTGTQESLDVMMSILESARFYLE